MGLLSAGANTSKGTSQSTSRSSSDSAGYGQSGVIDSARPGLRRLYDQAGQTFMQGYTPYSGAWHPGLDPRMDTAAKLSSDAVAQGTPYANMALRDAVQRSPYQAMMQAEGGPGMQRPDALNQGLQGFRDIMGGQGASAPGSAGAAMPQYNTPGAVNPVEMGNTGQRPRYQSNAQTPQWNSEAQWNDIQRQRSQAGLNAFGGGIAGLGNIAAGGNNPYLDRQVQGATQDIVDRFGDVKDALNTTFSGAGRTGSGAHARAIGERASDALGAIGDVSARMRGAAYESDRNRQLSASQSLGQLGLARHEGEEGRNLAQYQTDVGARTAKYGTDTQAALGRYSADTTRYGQDLSNALGRYNTDASMYNADRDRDLQKYGMDLSDRLGMRGQDVSQALGRYQTDAGLRGQTLSNQLGNRQVDADLAQSNEANRLRAAQGLTDAGLQSQQVGNQGQQLANEAFRNQANYQLGALGLMPQFQNSRMNQLQSLFGMGQQLTDARQGILDSRRAQHDYQQFAPWNWLNQYGNILHQAPTDAYNWNTARSRSTSDSRSTNKSGGFNLGWPAKG